MRNSFPLIDRETRFFKKTPSIVKKANCVSDHTCCSSSGGGGAGGVASSEVERVGRTATAGLPPDLPPLQELVWRRLRRRGVTPPGPSGFNEGSSSHNPGSPTGPGSDLSPTVADLSQSRSSQRGSNHLSYMVDQVWSLTHFYSLIFSRSTVKETLYFIGLFSP